MTEQQKRLAWVLAKRRARMLTSFWPERIRTRDVAGTALADAVALARMLLATQGVRTQTTEIERRAVVCARRRLQEKNNSERSSRA